MEPAALSVRPIHMRLRLRRVLAPALLPLLAGFAACGQQGAPSSDPAPAELRQWRECTAAEFDRADGDVSTLRNRTWPGALVVKLPTQGPCSGGLVARGPAGVVGADVAELGLVAGSAQVLETGGETDHALMRLDGGVHPRGGFQPHLFHLGPDLVEEITAGGAPVVPFIATDGGMAPMTVRCGDGTLEVLTATTSEPPGVVIAWDVERTTYDLTPGRVRRTSSEQVREHAADPVLHRDLPALFDLDRLFEGC